MSVYRVFYGDGKTYDGPPRLSLARHAMPDALCEHDWSIMRVFGLPQFTPTDDVQIIVQYDIDRGWIMTQRADCYIWRYGRWWGADYLGMIDYLRTPGWKRILYGRTMRHRDFAEVEIDAQTYQRAKAQRNYVRQHGALPEKEYGLDA